MIGREVVSLFTGGGGLDLGFELAGFRTVAAVDNDPEACRTLRANRPAWSVRQCDIRDFAPGSEVAVVIGGPPCQGYSYAGKRDPSDPRNYLWREYVRTVRAVMPRALVFENVPGFAAGRGVEHLSGVLESLRALGYGLVVGVLNAVDFGVPQNRRRLIVIGLREGSPTLPAATRVGPPATVGEALADIGGYFDPEWNHVQPRHAPHVEARWDALAPGELDPSYRRTRLDPAKPSVTIRAGGGYGPRGDHLAGFHPPIHPHLPRQLTVREAARLQSFPDYWIFHGSKTAQGRQVGNAVPVLLAEGIARHVACLLEVAA